MEFGTINVTINGLTPLLMHRMINEDLKKKGRRTTKHEYTPEEEARRFAYIHEDGNGGEELYIPSVWIYSCLVGAASLYRSGKVYMSSILAGTIRVEPECISLGTDQYLIDERPVVIQRARILRHRPRLDTWSASFSIVYNKTILSSDSVKLIETILEDAGVRKGIGNYRPQHKGWFGTFEVTHFEVMD